MRLYQATLIFFVLFVPVMAQNGKEGADPVKNKDRISGMERIAEKKESADQNAKGKPLIVDKNENPIPGNDIKKNAQEKNPQSDEVFVFRGEVIAVQKNQASIRIASGNDKHGCKNFLLRDPAGNPAGSFQCMRVDRQGRDVIMLGSYIPPDEEDMRTLTMGFHAGFFVKRVRYPQGKKYQVETIPPKKEIRDALDKKVMVYIDWDYLVYGQGDDASRDNFNPYFYERDVSITPRIHPFYIDKYEVTNHEYYTFCKKANHPLPPSWKEHGNKYPPGTADHPITEASYSDAEAYAAWTGKRLPTELEWELAARGGLKKLDDGSGPKNLLRSPPIYPGGDEFSSHICNTYESGLVPVSVYKTKDVSPYGVFGMCGNAREWTSSDYRPYPGHQFRTKNAGKLFKVIRGGSYHQTYENARFDARDYGGFPDLMRDKTAGFRLVRAAP